MDKQLSAMKTLVSSLAVLSCALRPAFGATNGADGTHRGSVIASSGYEWGTQSAAGWVTTALPGNVLFQYAVKGMDTNSLNASSNGRFSTPGQQPART